VQKSEPKEFAGNELDVIFLVLWEILMSNYGYMVEQYNIAEESSRALQNELSIAPRTWMTVDEMIKKKKTEDHNAEVLRVARTLAVTPTIDNLRIVDDIVKSQEEQRNRIVMCSKCDERHSIVECPNGVNELGWTHPLCENCKDHHSGGISCHQAMLIRRNWDERLQMRMMVGSMENEPKENPKFNEVDLNPVHEVFKEWLTGEEEEELQQKKFWENLKDLSQFPEEQPLQSITESVHDESRETTMFITEPTVPGSCYRKLEDSYVAWTAGQPSGRPASRPNKDSDPEIFVRDSLKDSQHPEPVIDKEIVIKARVPFTRRRMDLSIYTFDDSDDDDINEEAREDLTAADKEYKDGEDFMKQTNQKKHRCKLRKVRSKAERSHMTLTKKLSSAISPLKRTHWNSGKRSRGWRPRKGNSLDCCKILYILTFVFLC